MSGEETLRGFPAAGLNGEETLRALLAGQELELATAAETQALGVALGRHLRAGDLVLLTGGLAAGKTTLTQGIGQGLAVRGPITSPTFVIARVHPHLSHGPDLVHVDAYRLGGLAELDDLDLDTDLSEVVTVVEWGHGLAEELADEWLEVMLTRAETTDPDSQARRVRVRGHGPRWSGASSSRGGGPTAG